MAADRSEVLQAMIRTIELVQTRIEDDDTLRLALVQLSGSIETLARHLREGRSGRDTILLILQTSYPDPVSSTTLRVLSGIQEHARRIRELRVESGYDIASEANGQYRLRFLEPNEERANHWRMLNGIRRRPGSAADRLRELFTTNVGTVFDREELSYVANIEEWARRVRELRSEAGLRIESHHDNPALSLDSYVLVDPEPIPVSERNVSASQRQRVLERDGYACVLCGRPPDNRVRIWLEVDHIHTLEDGGSNEDDNLRTLCNRCHRAR